ncbi:MAG: ABC transporter permease [candidate division Zixibacteria bacterium]
MFKNYLKVAVRNILRHKGYSLINILGFAAGLTTCILIALYISFEFGYDTYHEDNERIYRVIANTKYGEELHSWAATPEPLGPTIQEYYSNNLDVARIQELGRVRIKKGEESLYEYYCLAAGPKIFDILSIPFIAGNPNNALEQPQTAVITKSIAEKYFSNYQVVGEVITINDQDYRISGVIADYPENTHLKYNFLLSFSTFEPNENMQNWGRMSTYTYLKLSPDANANRLTEDINRTIGAHATEILAKHDKIMSFALQPIIDIHLHSDLWGEISPPGSLPNIIVFSIIGFIILTTACINYVNLTTARFINRHKEVGMRKTIGASRYQLIIQFLGESVLMTLLSLALAYILVELLSPLLSSILNIKFSTINLTEPIMLLSIIGFALMVGLIAGCYPAFIFSAFKPVTFFRGVFSSNYRHVTLRKLLVIFQFVASIVLIISLLTVSKQIYHMKNQPLGFDNSHKLVLPLARDISIADNYETIKNEFTRYPGITGATVSSSIPGRINYIHAFKAADIANSEYKPFYHFFFDGDFISEYGIQLADGRSFQKEMPSDLQGAIIINETAVRAFGWSSASEAIGKSVDFGEDRLNVIGVTNDFHFHGLQRPIEPIVMQMYPGKFHSISLSLQTNNTEEVIADIKKTFLKLFPNTPFRYYFAKEDFEKNYGAEEKMGAIAGGFTGLAIILTCLGLLGLTSFSIESRSKEISIRKVFGASINAIIRLVTREFIILVAMANIIAWPIAYLAMSRWLENFAYRTEITWTVFTISGIAALIFAILTVSFQAIKAATANPVDAIKHE